MNWLVSGHRKGLRFCLRLFLFMFKEIFMSDSLVYLTIDQQIEKLKNQHLFISDENFAKEQLQQFGYSLLLLFMLKLKNFWINWHFFIPMVRWSSTEMVVVEMTSENLSYRDYGKGGFFYIFYFLTWCINPTISVYTGMVRK